MSICSMFSTSWRFRPSVSIRMQNGQALAIVAAPVSLSWFVRAKLTFVSPEILRLTLDLMNDVRHAGLAVNETYSVAEAIEDADVLYMTRVQKERFTDLEQYEEVKGFYTITPDLMRRAKENMIVMHPLPRVGEIQPEVDSDPRAAYFRQVQNGMFVRMALLAAVLGKA